MMLVLEVLGLLGMPLITFMRWRDARYYGGQPYGVVMHVIDANRPSPPAGAGCTLHSGPSA
ncbi:hypothetical protein ACGFNV_06740 [Streptomyces sp. NPDC048751]|uniref:hypothetical protein n=1 Tax=Streptomyces sp. NPDC048751 TaxID=3365591 RepID=UPI0037141108